MIDLLMAAHMVIKDHDNGLIQQSDPGDCGVIEDLRVAVKSHLRSRADHLWVSVEDELPDSDLTVDVYAAPQGCPDAFDVATGHLDGDQWYSCDGSRLIVTHWRERPAAPCHSNVRRSSPDGSDLYQGMLDSIGLGEKRCRS